MNVLIFVFIFLLGVMIGSFLNVVIYRLNSGKSIVRGRSICMTCNKELRWFELIPLFSFLIQNGKCRRCAIKISHQYPIVEFLTGLVFVLIAYRFLPVMDISSGTYIFLIFLYVYIFSLLIVISIYDLRHKIIPDKLVYLFILISFLSIFINTSFITSSSIFVLPSISLLIAGPVLAIPFAALWYFSKGRLMGLGDGKLILGLGWLLGLSAGLFSLVISFWLGTIVGLTLIFLSKKKMNMKTEIPFAPFLIICAFITFLFNFNFYSLIKFFSLDL